MQAVREGRVRFHPERWTKVYLDWMEQIRDWNISRQLWWGHRIPVWYCPCGEVVASVDPPSRCPRCGGAALTQDPDILDTWFSSALWPIATLGWPEETEDLRYFYPTDALVTARDIIFLWVARMIMFGLEFRGEVPFRDVYINPTVLNIEGRRMSKSLGTGLDPLDLVDRYGADSLRFALINRVTGEQDLRFAEKMVQDTRTFANKVWNAARFVRMALGDRAVPPGPPAREGLTLADRWALSRFARAAVAVTEALERFEFHEVCQRLYAFIWSEYCDWYLEMAKADLEGPGRPGGETLRVLAWVLSQTMQLLHPVMPALTEEIWQALPHEGETIMRAPWPVPAAGPGRAAWLEGWLDEAAEAQMETIMGVVHTARGMRASIGMAAQPVTMSLYVPPGDAALRRLLDGGRRYIGALMKVDGARLAIEPAGRPRPAGTILVPWGPLEIAIHVDSAGARRTIAERLRKELAAVERDLGRLAARLESREFLDRAPAEVVQADRARTADLAARREVLRRQLSELDA